MPKIKKENCHRCLGAGTICSFCLEPAELCDCPPLFAETRETPAEYPDHIDCTDCDGTGKIEVAATPEDEEYYEEEGE